MSDKIILKGIFIFFLVVILWISTFFISSLVDERKEYREDVTEVFAQTWASEQILGGPFLYLKDRDGEYIAYTPDSLHIKADIQTTIRHRGIYKIPVYTATITYSGYFKTDSLSSLYKYLKKNISILSIFDSSKTKNWKNKVKLHFGLYIKDFKGLSSNILWEVNGKKLKSKKGDLANVLYTNVKWEDTLYFKTQFKIKGLDEISFQPAGLFTRIDVNSNWSSPAFAGNFLPEDYKITKDGFTANWQIIEFNKKQPHLYVFNSKYIIDDKASIKFLSVNNVYRQTDRALKYSFAILMLTFLVFFFIEQMKNVRLHLVNYALIGAALVVFYSLLLGLSENISFDLSYWIATFMTVGLISLYFWLITKNKGLATSIFLGFTFLYGFIFVLLNMQTYAMLIGSFGAFLIIALFMFLSLKVNWNKGK